MSHFLLSFQDAALNAIKQASSSMGRPEAFMFMPQKLPLATKLMRKPSIDRDLQPNNASSPFFRGSPVVDSGAGSSRSDSPHSHQQLTSSRASTGQYSPSPCPSSFSDAPPPPPPRCSSTPPTPPPVPQNLQQFYKRMSPATAVTTSSVNSRTSLPISQSPARGTSPVSSISSGNNLVNGSLSNGVSPGGVSNGGNRQPMIVQNGPHSQQQLSQQMQALSLYQSGGNSGEPPPPYPIIPPGAPPPSYISSIQSRQSPTQSTITTTTTASVASSSDYRKSPSSGIYSATSTAGSPSPITVSQQQQQGNGSMARPIALSAWGARQTKTQPPIIMQSVKSTQVQKPVLQTAIAPTAPTPASNNSPQSVCVSPVMLSPPAPPSYALSIQQKSQQQMGSSSPSPTHLMQNGGLVKSQTSKTPSPPPSSSPVPILGNAPPALPSKKSDPNLVGKAAAPVPTTEPPSYASTMQAILASQQQSSTTPQSQQQSQNVQSQQNPPPRHHLPPPPPYSTNTGLKSGDKMGQVTSTPPLPPQTSSSTNSQAGTNLKGANGKDDKKLTVANSGNKLDGASSASSASIGAGSSNKNEIGLPLKKIKHQSPIPVRKKIGKDKSALSRNDIRIKHYSPQVLIEFSLFRI